MRLANRVAIITGAASGIGRATAIRFAQEGAAVLIADINEAGGRACAEAITAAGGKARFVPTDVSRESDLRHIIDVAVQSYGGLHILHNNAFWNGPGTALEVSVEAWAAHLGRNPDGCVAGFQAGDSAFAGERRGRHFEYGVGA